jgi:predicted porin
MTGLESITVVVVLAIAFVASELSLYEEVKQTVEYYDEKERQKQAEQNKHKSE